MKRKLTPQQKEDMIKIVKFLGSLNNNEFKTVKKVSDKLNKSNTL